MDSFMADDLLAQLAARAGVSPVWRDQKGGERQVSPQSLRAILAALGAPAETDAQARDSLSALRFGPALGARLIAAQVGQPVRLAWSGPAPATLEATLEDGEALGLRGLEKQDGALILPAFSTPGYHRLHLPGGDVTLAAAPERCVTFADLKDGEPGWGLSAQIYALRSAHDGSIGDFGGVAALARSAARRGADFLALSPVHALFGADPGWFSPYSPSTRLFFNPVYADPALVLPESLARQALAESGVAEKLAQLSAAPLVDWSAGHAAKAALFRACFELLTRSCGPVATDFFQFRDTASGALREFALFEALQAEQTRLHPARGDWRLWPESLRRPDGADALIFADAHRQAIDYQLFLQWLVDRSARAAQQAGRDAGMEVGLIADLAIGMVPNGAHAWARPEEVLSGLSIGAPPDYYSAEGQNWGLTGLSPRGLEAAGFAPFIETLRASLRHAGGLRIDHVMGLSRLWLIPQGASALDGAYVDFPAETLFRLIALESWRHRAIVIGEDLGTLPSGFRQTLRDKGLAGMRVLRFEREAHGLIPPDGWSPEAVAMTATHDMIATSGWWKGADLDDVPDRAELEEIRAWDRGLIWGSFERAGLARGERPAPENPGVVVDAALSYIASTPCIMKLAALEDVLGLDVQPNVPGTTAEKPNWRHRLPGPAAELLDSGEVGGRLARLGAKP